MAGSEQPIVGRPPGLGKYVLAWGGLAIVVPAVVVTLSYADRLVARVILRAETGADAVTVDSPPGDEVTATESMSCRIAGAEGAVLQVACDPTGSSSGDPAPLAVLVDGVAFVKGVTSATARAAYGAALADAVNIFGGLDQQCEIMRAPARPTLIACPGLARFLVAEGAARATSAQLRSVERQARAARAGLHADVARAEIDRRVLVQTWLATALGLLGAMLGFFYSTDLNRKLWQDRRARGLDELRRLRDDYLMAYGGWATAAKDDGSFAAALRAFADALDAQRTTHDVDPTLIEDFREIADICSAGQDDDDESWVEERKKVVSQKYTKLDRHVGAQIFTGAKGGRAVADTRDRLA